MIHDLRLAIRALRATPIVSIVAILSLALGIGANTAIFSLIDSLMLRTLPVQDPARLALLTDDESPASAGSWTHPIWEQLRERSNLFDGALAWSTRRFNLAAGGETRFVDGIWVSGAYFQTLGVPAILGRTLTDADDRRSGGVDGPVAVISYSFWQRYFGGAADAIGRTLTLDRVPFTIVGVTPPEFFGTDIGSRFDVAVPLGDEPLIRGRDSGLDRRSMWWLSVMVRMRPGQSLDQATASLRGVQPQIREATLPENWRPPDLARYLKDRFVLFPASTGSSFLRERFQRPLMTIMIVVALVLLIACANIANLLLARALARRHELGVRVALGASRWRLIRQLMTESLLLSATGAAFGIAIASWGSRLLVRQLSTQTNTVFLDLSLDWRVLAFTIGVTAATALLFGTAPALRAARVAPIDALKEHTRSSAGDARAGVTSGLVVVQVALSVLLVVAAGLFARTFALLDSVHLGFDADRVLVVDVDALRANVEPAQRIPLYERVRDAVRAVPGVADAAISVVTPVSGRLWSNRIKVSDGIELPERQRQSNFNYVTPGWLSTYGTAIVAGRDIGPQDRKGAPLIALVNEAFARRFFGGASPLGHTVQTDGVLGPAPKREIVGVVADAVYISLREPVPPTTYVPLGQYDLTMSPPLPAVNLSVRANGGSPVLLTKSIAAAVGAVNPDLALTFRPLTDQINASLSQERIVAMLSGFFGALALLLAGLGLYGVTSYAVTRRRAEIGIRMALGAAPAGVMRLVLSRVALLVGIGVIVGAGASMWLSRFVATLLYGLEPRDPATLAGAAATLAGVGALAGWLPAYRASRIDPAQVLRNS
jgi:putative ABC transport system permease protein